MRESETVELKRSTSELDEAMISIVAILNKHGRGELFFGVRDDGTPCGQDVTANTLREVSKAIADRIEPRIFPKVLKINLFERECILVEFEGADAPYFARGRAYVRVGDENRKISPAELKRLLLKSNEHAWEKGFSEKTPKDIKTSLLRDYIRRGKEAGRIGFSFKDAEATLLKLGLLKDGRLLRAAEVLFCDVNSLELQAAVFAGKDKLTFLDINQFRGDIFSLIEKSNTYISEHMNWRAELTGDGRREIPEVPVRAIEEAVVNSLCHRDYFNPTPNYIAVYKDRIEISNPGVFPDDRTPEDYIKGDYDSVLRNPLIANTLFLSKDIEKWGSGLKRIYDACKESGVKVEFRCSNTGFSVVFYRPDWVGEKVGEKVGETMTTNQEKILRCIVDNPRISAKELSAIVRISSRKIEANIAKLKEKGVLSRIGPDKGGRWEVRR